MARQGFYNGAAGEGKERAGIFAPARTPVPDRRAKATEAARVANGREGSQGDGRPVIRRAG